MTDSKAEAKQQQKTTAIVIAVILVLIAVPVGFKIHHDRQEAEKKRAVSRLQLQQWQDTETAVRGCNAAFDQVIGKSLLFGLARDTNTPTALALRDASQMQGFYNFRFKSYYLTPPTDTGYLLSVQERMKQEGGNRHYAIEGSVFGTDGQMLKFHANCVASGNPVQYGIVAD